MLLQYHWNKFTGKNKGIGQKKSVGIMKDLDYEDKI